MMVSGFHLGALRLQTRLVVEPTLVSIPVGRGRRALALVRPAGRKRVAALVFGPLLETPTPDLIPLGWRPALVRKAIVEDLGLRDGSWSPVRLPDARPEIDAMFAAAEPILEALAVSGARDLVAIDETTAERASTGSRAHLPIVFTAADVETFERGLATMFDSALRPPTSEPASVLRARRLLAAALRASTAEPATALLMHVARVPEITSAYAAVDRLGALGYAVTFDLTPTHATLYATERCVPSYRGLAHSVDRIGAIVEEFDGVFVATQALPTGE